MWRIWEAPTFKPSLTISLICLYCQSESRFDVLGFLVKITVLFILSLAAAEGAYYWRFSKPALSRMEFQDGYNSVVNAASESPYLSQVKSKVDSFHHHHEVKRPTKRTAPLSSLPTISGVAYTSDRAESADSDELWSHIGTTIET